jgi:tetratricopeptide (TPR) repeat protein
MYGNSMLNRAFYYMTTNRTSQAMDFLQSAVAKYKEVLLLDPTASNAYNNLGLAYLYLSKMKEAIECFERAIELEPTVPFFHDNLGDAYYKNGQISESVKEWELVLELDPNYKPVKGFLPTPQRTVKEKIREARRRM